MLRDLCWKACQCAKCLVLTVLHAGLDSAECKLVETAYQQGVVQVLCCTTTMAVGVNLPARRVIFRQPYIGLQNNPITVAE